MSAYNIVIKSVLGVKLIIRNLNIRGVQCNQCLKLFENKHSPKMERLNTTNINLPYI